MSLPFAQKLETELSNLHNAPKGRLTIQSANHWAVLHSLDVPTRALLEVTSNTYLPKDSLLTQTQMAQLSDLSYTQRRRKRSLGKLVPIAGATHWDQLITELSYVFEDIFQTQTDELDVVFTPDARHEPNKSLLQHEEDVSEQTAFPSNGLYKAL